MAFRDRALPNRDANALSVYANAVLQLETS